MNVKNNHGFTIVEIVVTTVIISILATIAVTALINWLPNFRLKTAASALFADLQSVKTEAIKRKANVVVLFDSPNDEYSMFVDNGDGGGTRDDFIINGSEETLKTITLNSDIVLNPGDFNGTQATGFNQRGFPAGNRNGFIVMQNAQSRFYRITISASGSITNEISSDGSTWH